jgi:hypothetical protein
VITGGEAEPVFHRLDAAELKFEDVGDESSIFLKHERYEDKR